MADPNKSKNKIELSIKDIFLLDDIVSEINFELGNALLLHRMKGLQKATLHPLMLTMSWELVENKTKTTLNPVDVDGNIEEISISEIKNRLKKNILNSPDIDHKYKEMLINAIYNFITENFIVPKKKEKNHFIYTKSFPYYQKIIADLKISPLEKKVYEDIYLFFIAHLYQKDHNYLDKESWAISKEWLDYIWTTFYKVIKRMNNGSKESWTNFNKIFHDWDFNFLEKTDTQGKPIIGTVGHYVQIVAYLMSIEYFNPYEKDLERWADQWIQSKKIFLNNLYLEATNLNIPLQERKLTDKEELHNMLAILWQESFPISGSLHRDWIPSNRSKSEDSTSKKGTGRTTNIQDESGLRATLISDNLDRENKTKNIITILDNYLSKLRTTSGIELLDIEYNIVEDFIGKEEEAFIINYFKKKGLAIKPKKRKGEKTINLHKVVNIYEKELNIWKASKALKKAYSIANGAVKRGGNGEYSDIKFNIKIKADPWELTEIFQKNKEMKKEKNKIVLLQEISFYDEKNELNMWNHSFLDLEKWMYSRTKVSKNMKKKKKNLSDENQNIKEGEGTTSLNRIRYHAERAIKEISANIDRQKKAAHDGFRLPLAKEYTYLEIGKRKLSLENLVYRNKKNDKRFDVLIAEVINYFIKKNKLIYFNKEGENFSWLISKEQLKDPKEYKRIRFTTPDPLSVIARNPENKNATISFYDWEEDNSNKTKEQKNNNFHTLKIGEFRKFSNLDQYL